MNDLISRALAICLLVHHVCFGKFRVVVKLVMQNNLWIYDLGAVDLNYI